MLPSIFFMFPGTMTSSDASNTSSDQDTTATAAFDPSTMIAARENQDTTNTTASDPSTKKTDDNQDTPRMPGDSTGDFVDIRSDTYFPEIKDPKIASQIRHAKQKLSTSIDYSKVSEKHRKLIDIVRVELEQGIVLPIFHALLMGKPCVAFRSIKKRKVLPQIDRKVEDVGQDPHRAHDKDKVMAESGKEQINK
jgi:hypothetical protein